MKDKERTTLRSDALKRRLIHRLERVNGQVGALTRMIEEDRYCPDILLQTSAAIGALRAFSRELLILHVRTCFTDDIRAGKDDATEELVKLLQQLLPPSELAAAVPGE